MFIRNYEDRIRELCAKLRNASDDEWEPILAELKATIHEHLEWVRSVATGALKGAREKQNPAA